MQKMAIVLIAGKDDEGRRLDRILRKALPDHSLSLLHRLLRQRKVLVNKKPASPETRIHSGDIIKVNSKISKVNIKVDIVNSEYKQVNVKCPLPESLIIWRGSGIIVFNKPAGIAVHGPESTGRVHERTLDACVRDWLEVPPSLSFRPGPLHRLDKPTSGALAFSETLEGAKLFSALLHDRLIEKIYLAIVQGRLENKHNWNDALIRDKELQITKTASGLKNGVNAKDALTSVLPLACNGVYSLLELRIKTGRTHQIRAQAAARGHPLTGDTKYGGLKFEGRNSFFLHAWKLEFNDKAGIFPGIITAPPPEAFLSQVYRLFGQDAVKYISKSATPP
jgi:23S rRNA pseudouridine955/2504/2580 synthase